MNQAAPTGANEIRAVNDRPRLVLAGLSGGAGKTILTLGICRALAAAGLRVRPFKKGPDYIDAAWLGLAAGRDATNLDPFLLPESRLLPLFLEKSRDVDISVVEGNRGIFDGMDVAGSCSTAALARQLDAPVVLILDATKMTRTAAALVAGVAAFEPGLNLAGVVANRTAGARHRDILRRSIESLARVPVVGLLPKIPKNPIPERHMGLVSDREQGAVDAILDGIAAVVREHVDLDRLVAIARSAPPLPDAAPDAPACDAPLSGAADSGEAPVIGVVRDAALWFYYPENLEALEQAGARLAAVSLLDDAPWPALDGLYLGGGFPETHVEALAKDTAMRARVAGLAASGMPVYAECGGFMYLCRGLVIDGAHYPMAGVFPVDTTLCAKPQGLGYSLARVVADNPFHPVGTLLHGHEFHYSRCQAALEGSLPGPESFCLRMERGVGMHAGHDGLLFRNTFAAYTHIHAHGAPHWARNFVNAAREWKRKG